MEFRLIYKGALPSERSSPRPRDKHQIRRIFHEQLAELWKQHRFLRDVGAITKDPETGKRTSRSLDSYADQYRPLMAGVHTYRFLPLIGEKTGISCALDILFLRRDSPGGLVVHGGDIDNRLKVLFDALRMPRCSDEVRNCPPAPDEDPFFCVLEDDRYIDRVSLVNDRLLTPLEPKEHIHDVLLVIQVKTLIFDADRAWRGSWAV